MKHQRRPQNAHVESPLSPSYARFSLILLWIPDRSALGGHGGSDVNIVGAHDDEGGLSNAADIQVSVLGVVVSEILCSCQEPGFVTLHQLRDYVLLTELNHLAWCPEGL